MESPRQFEVPWGWEFGNHLILVGSPSRFEFMEMESLISSYPCEQPKSISSSLGVGTLISSYPCGQSMHVSWKFHGGGNFDTIFSLWTVQVNLKFRGVGFLISSYPCGQSTSICCYMGVGLLISSYPCGQSKSI